MTNKIDYLMIHNPYTDRWCAWAGTLAKIELFGGSRSTYTAAREALTRAANAAGLTLGSFQGEFSIAENGELVKIVCDFVRGHTIKHGSQTGLTVEYAQYKNGATWIVATDRDGKRYDLLASECKLDR